MRLSSLWRSGSMSNVEGAGRVGVFVVGGGGGGAGRAGV